MPHKRRVKDTSTVMQNKLSEQKKKTQLLAKEWGHALRVLCILGRTWDHGFPGSCRAKAEEYRA